MKAFFPVPSPVLSVTNPTVTESTSRAEGTCVIASPSPLSTPRLVPCGELHGPASRKPFPSVQHQFLHFPPSRRDQERGAI